VGCGGGELRASAPAAHHVQQVLDVDDTVAIRVTCAWSGAVVTTFVSAEPGAIQGEAVDFTQLDATGTGAAAVCFRAAFRQDLGDMFFILVIDVDMPLQLWEGIAADLCISQGYGQPEFIRLAV
jgi:hypothetical protein